MVTFPFLTFSVLVCVCLYPAVIGNGETHQLMKGVTDHAGLQHNLKLFCGLGAHSSTDNSEMVNCGQTQSSTSLPPNNYRSNGVVDSFGVSGKVRF